MKHRLSLPDLWKLTFESLRYEYEILKKKAISREDFAREIYSIVFNNNDPNVEDFYEIPMQFVSDEIKKKGKEYVARTPYAPLLTASAFLARCIKAYENREMDLAWSYMTDVRYWTGVVRTFRGIEAAYQQTVKETKRNVASKGAQARAENYDVLSQFSYKLVHEKEPRPSGWKSRRHAVQVIKKHVLAHAKELKIKLSENQADRTIGNWLAKMPDATQLFSKKAQSK